MPHHETKKFLIRLSRVVSFDCTTKVRTYTMVKNCLKMSHFLGISTFYPTFFFVFFICFSYFFFRFWIFYYCVFVFWFYNSVFNNVTYHFHLGYVFEKAGVFTWFTATSTKWGIEKYFSKVVKAKESRLTLIETLLLWILLRKLTLPISCFPARFTHCGKIAVFVQKIYLNLTQLSLGILVITPWNNLYFNFRAKKSRVFFD